MRTTRPVDSTLQPIAEIDQTVHAPARLMILAYLFVVESADFVFLMKQTGLTRGNLSSHLRRLEEAGYVEISKEFVERIPRTLIRLTDQGRDALRAYNQNMQKVLDRLAG